VKPGDKVRVVVDDDPEFNRECGVRLGATGTVVDINTGKWATYGFARSHVTVPVYMDPVPHLHFFEPEHIELIQEAAAE